MGYLSGERVLVAMSGGVDSAAAAVLLHDAGCRIAGVTMCLGITVEGSTRPVCCGPDGVRDARAVCDRLGVPHYVFDYTRPLKDLVIDPFVAEYRAGRTPNPCVLCNARLKFSLLLNKAKGLGFPYIATGHYAAIREVDGVSALFRAKDRRKDQTYFLYGMPRAGLSSVLFPLADLHKEETRAVARGSGLAVAERAESQDICFVASGTYRDLLGPAPDAGPGPFVDVRGTVIGTHRGIASYTVGQRKGLGIAAGHPLYVVRIEPVTNTVVLGDEQSLYGTGLVASGLNLFVDTLPARAAVQIRYAHDPMAADIALADGVLSVRFDHPEKAVTPGQSAVLYDGDRVLGGGIIDRAHVDVPGD